MGGLLAARVLADFYDRVTLVERDTLPGDPVNRRGVPQGKLIHAFSPGARSPHSPIGNQSLVPVAEDQADYAMWWINRLRDGVVRAAAPTEVVTKEYNAAMKAAMPQTIWVTGCSSWYLGKDGLPELFPWTPENHHELVREPRLADFDVRTA